MRLTLAFALAASLASVPAFAADRNFPVGGFEKVILSGSPDVDVRVGPAASVVATGEAADLDRLDIKVEGNALVIATKPGSWSWSSRKGVHVAVTVPSLSAASISGSGDMSVDRVQGPFTGRISGSGDLTVGSVTATTLGLSISGSGDIDVGAGTCGTGNFSTTGSGEIDAANVRCQTVSATVTGSGDIEGQATDTAALRLTGSGNVTVTGGARCTTHTTGSGTTRCG